MTTRSDLKFSLFLLLFFCVCLFVCFVFVFFVFLLFVKHKLDNAEASISMMARLFLQKKKLSPLLITYKFPPPQNP